MIFGSIIFGFIIAAAVAHFAKHQRLSEFMAVIASGWSLASTLFLALHIKNDGPYKFINLFTVDSLSMLVTLIAACVAFFSVVYAVVYFRKEAEKNIIGQSRVRQYFTLSNLFLAVLFLAATADNPVLAWIFLEATTLSSIFLISYYSKRSTIEAAWKALIINAIGLLLAFLGTLLFLSVSSGLDGIMNWNQLLANAAQLNPVIAKIAFAFVLIGYGVKIGFAPMHTWKPDAYGKAPAPLAALFSGALLPVAFALLLRFKLVTDAAVGSSYSNTLFIIFGLFSIFVAAFCILTAQNYKRMLAYSSIEHAGIMALGFAFGGIGVFAALLHMIYHSLIKSAMFFATGNILIKYHTAKIAKVSGALSIIPITSVILLVGLFAITGFPPFGMFLTEVSIASAGIGGSPVIAVLMLILIAVVFIGLFRQVSAMVLSSAKLADKTVRPGENGAWLLIPSVGLLLMALVLTFYMPDFLHSIINDITTRF